LVPRETKGSTLSLGQSMKVSVTASECRLSQGTQVSSTLADALAVELQHASMSAAAQGTCVAGKHSLLIDCARPMRFKMPHQVYHSRCSGQVLAPPVDIAELPPWQLPQLLPVREQQPQEGKDALLLPAMALHAPAGKAQRHPVLHLHPRGEHVWVDTSADRPDLKIGGARTPICSGWAG
jgi:hypothetical protein